jgi:hypothetical protein
VRRVIPFFAVAALLSLASPSRAALTFTFLENGSGLLGANPSTFTESGTSITATGYNSTLSGSTLTLGTLTALFAKNTPGDPSETGLGLNKDSDKEISKTGTIQLNLTSLTSPLTLKISSLQEDETYKVYADSNKLVPIFSGVGTGPEIITLTLPGGGIYDVTSSKGNILIGSVTGVAAVPEPSTLISACTAGLIGIFYARRRRNRSAA